MGHGLNAQTSHQSAAEHPQTSVIWQQFAVPFRFPVVFTRALFDPDNPVFRQTLCELEANKRHRLLVFVDAGVMRAMPQLANSIEQYCNIWSESLDLVQPPVMVNGGESIKSDARYLETLQAALQAHAIDRHSYVVAIGGGAVLDAIGFVAATAHRGIRHVRIPTTVLAQNDSGVGVKNAVNQFGQKNYLGSFAPPHAVLNDSEFLRCLPEREALAGMAEAIKVALIRDAEFFNWLEANADDLKRFDATAMDTLIRRCAELHMRQIGQGGDPFEQGSARPLDFGHWAAHRLETLTQHQLRHGEAVAIGMALDNRYAVLAGLLDEADEQRITRLLKQLGFELWHDAVGQSDATGQHCLLSGLEEFQAHLGGDLCITLLNCIGEGAEVHEMDKKLLVKAIEDLAVHKP